MPRYQDNYNQNNTVAPSGAPNDYLTTRATPQQMGAGVGEAMQGVGRQIGKSADDMSRVILQEQGLANEHEITSGELDLAVKGGDVYNKFLTMQGLDASNSKDAYVQQYLDVNNKIREKLSNPAVQRGYDQLAARRMMFTIQNMNAHAATEQNKAYRQGNEATIKQAVDDAGTYLVASDPKQIDHSMASIIFSANTLYTAPKYGKYQTVPATVDPATGKLKFDASTEQGKMAQADYDQYLDTHMGDAYKAAVKILANNGDINKAMDFYNNNQANMSTATRASIAHELSGPWRMAQTRTVANDTFGSVMAGFAQHPTARNASDFVSMNFEEILQKGDEAAEKLHPGDVVFAQQARNQLAQKLQSVIKDQTRMNTVNSHVLYDYLNKNDISDISQLNNAPPGVKSAYEDLVAANPNALYGITHMVTSKSFNRLSGYGPGYYGKFMDVAEGRVSNIFEGAVQADMGKNSPLTNHGYDAIHNSLSRYQNKDGSVNPEGAAFIKAQAAYFMQKHKEYVGMTKDPYETSEKFGQFLDQAVPMIEGAIAKGKKEGKSLTEIAKDIFTPTVNGKPNPAYIRTSVTPPSVMTLAHRRSATFGNPKGAPAYNVNQQDKFEADYNAGKLTDQQAIAIIKKNNWAPRQKQVPSTPSVPLPNDIGSGRE